MTGHLLFAILMNMLFLTVSSHEYQVQALLPPTLTVSTPVISETDSVTLHCQAPAPASVHHCYFYTGEQQGNQGNSCLQTLTGTELLLMSHQRSPAEVKVRCFYTVKNGAVNSPSAHSNSSSIIIQISSHEIQGRGQKPEMSVHHSDGEYVLICLLPGSVKDDTRCNLYFGEASRPVLSQPVLKKSSTKTNQRFCQFYVSVADFLSHLHYVQQKDASCDYTLESEPNSLSPRSDRYSMTHILEKESPTTRVNLPCTMTTEFPKLKKPESNHTSQNKTSESRATTTKSTSTTTTAKPQQNTSPSTTVNSPSKSAESSLTTARASTSTSAVDSPSEEVSRKANTKSSFTLTTAELSLSSFSASTSTTSVISPSGMRTLTVVLVVVGSGVTVGAILLVLALFRSKRRTEGYSLKRTRTNIQDDFVCMTNIDPGRMLPEGNDGAYSVITSIPGASCATGTEKLNKQERKEQDSDIYHPYATISEKPAAPVSQDMTYSMLQAH